MGSHLMNIRKAVRAIVGAALLSALVYAALAGFTDMREVASSITRMQPVTILQAVLLTLACYLLRAARWWYLMRVERFPVSAADALYAQFAGMTMTVTPGKVGEILKAYLGRELGGMPMTRGVSLVFVERLTDLLAVFALSTGALSVLSNGTWPLIVAASVAILGTVVVSNRAFHQLLLRVLGRQKWIREHECSANEILDAIHETLAPVPLTISLSIAIVGWACEGLAFAVIITGLGYDGLSVVTSVGVYAISTILGAFTFTPGGIGLTEASMAGLLVAAGAPAPLASAATLLVRVVTLWFGVAAGWVVLFMRRDIVKRLMGITASE